MLRKRFEYIKSVELPRQLSNDQLNWKCTKLCKFAEQYPGSNKTTCQHFYDLIRLKGMSTVVSEHADLNKFGQYGAGGGKLDNA